ncbi:MAG: YbhB/YbcL family Raf kinase inhibitor-like protein [Paludibacterium sp.]|uniref:YbhB/YbcL family Raf kinase inhibitor-like protein n=1 Tax=Paludibacterium sp. TaxID=1917523 RepID=UPI0025E5F239|nr:YbhB/YbcL family Raf kinase inhibitor-like protein [Paludibacterium sp.]MBV8049277.1 YbhB/YbcL family Raf kinase inhibitor-like protein [Paludibacterium sp.]
MKTLFAAALLIAAGCSHAFELTSQDIQEGQRLPERQVLDGFGCHGDNISPSLAWKDAPAGTKSFALTVYDPDAPSGSGWWHWLVVDLPAATRQLPAGASGRLAAGLETRTDFGRSGYGGACPPAGRGMHRYQFTIWALPVSKLDIAGPHVSPAMIGFLLNGMALGTARLTAIYWH